MRAIIFLALIANSSSIHAAPVKMAAVKVVPKSVAAPKEVPSVLYDFKGIPLEISLDEFRARPHPDGNSNAKTICTGEKIKRFSSSMEPYQVSIYNDVEKSQGVVKCIWVTVNDNKSTYVYAGDVVSLSLAGSGYGSRDYSFSFVRDPKDGVMRLYEIEAVSNRNAFNDVVQGLTGKWGAPKLVNDTVQNKMGANFPQVTAIWANPAASITTVDRWSKVDEMAILVVDARLSGLISAAKAAKKASIPNSI